MQKSNWPIERVVQALVDGQKVENITAKDIRIFLSYAAPATSTKPAGSITPRENSTTPGDLAALKHMHEEAKTNHSSQYCSL